MCMPAYDSSMWENLIALTNGCIFCIKSLPVIIAAHNGAEKTYLSWVCKAISIGEKKETVTQHNKFSCNHCYNHAQCIQTLVLISSPYTLTIPYRDYCWVCRSVSNCGRPITHCCTVLWLLVRKWQADFLRYFIPRLAQYCQPDYH